MVLAADYRFSPPIYGIYGDSFRDNFEASAGGDIFMCPLQTI